MKYEIFALICIFVMVLSTGQTSGATAKLYDVDYRYPSEISNLILTQNVNNDTQQFATTISEWQSDLGTSMMPNGTYSGTYFTGSKLHHYYKPSWSERFQIYPEWNNATRLEIGQYSYVLISAHFNWSPQIIMNGASEWWIRPPISPQSIEIQHGLIMGIFANKGSNASNVYLEPNYLTSPYYRSAQPGYGGALSTPLMRPTITGYIPQDYITYQFSGTTGQPVYNPFLMQSDSLFIMGEGKIANDRIYLKVNSILHPDTDYIISLVFRLPQRLGPTSGFYTYWSGMTNLSKWSHMQIYEFQQQIAIPIQTEFGRWTMNETANMSLDQPLDMDWSFIFTEGIGAGGLFGKKMAFSSNSTLSLYPYYNSSFQDEYMSFMIPFISDDNVTVAPEIHNSFYLPIGGYYPASRPHWWSFTDYLPYFIWFGSYNYSDFVLFSSDYELNKTTFNVDDPWNVKVKLNFLGGGPGRNQTRFYNITLLCYERIRPDKLWSDFIDNVTTSYNTSWSPMLRPSLNCSGVEIKLNYEVYCSARGTSLPWALYRGTVSGWPLYWFHFPQKIWVDPMEWKLTKEGVEALIELSQSDPYIANLQDWWGQTYYGEMMKFKFYDKTSALGGGNGIVRDTLSELLEIFKKIGEWLYIVGVAFIGQLIKFIGEVLDAVTAIVIYLAWLVAPGAFMLEVGWAAKMSKRLTHVKGEEDV